MMNNRHPQYTPSTSADFGKKRLSHCFYSPPVQPPVSPPVLSSKKAKSLFLLTPSIPPVSPSTNPPSLQEGEAGSLPVPEVGARAQ